MLTATYLLLQNYEYYENYSCHIGKTIEHYILADITTVQALPSSHQTLYVHGNMLNITSVLVVMKVVQKSQPLFSYTH